VEVDAGNHIISQNVVRPPESGDNIKPFHRQQGAIGSFITNIKDIATRVGFTGGSWHHHGREIPAKS